MPLEEDDQRRVDRAMEEAGADRTGTRLLVLNASEQQKLGFWTLVCYVLNRSVGSGIFVAPAILLKATGSPGACLLLWVLGAITSICSLLVWLEFSFSIPKFELQNRHDDDSPADGISLQCVPRSGGEKNFLEYVYGSNRFRKLRTTCMYGVIYITLGNLSGNAIAFGIYVLEAAGFNGGRDSLVRGLAVVCMTSACLLHATYRQGGIYLIIILAIFKLCILLVIIGVGFAAMGGKTYGYGSIQGQIIIDQATQTGPSNFALHASFAYAKKNFASYANSMLYVVYTFSGNEQPFYVISEVIRPKKTFAKATISGVLLVIVLFLLVNISYLGVVSYDPTLEIQCLSIKDTINYFDPILLKNAVANETMIEANCKLDMATVFFGAVFGGDVAPRVMAGIIATSIFGNIVVMTFTASRVKQEIAKEGILPFSLFFARSTTTPWALLRQRLWPEQDYEPEQSPAPALFLHWMFSMILIGATSARAADTAYQILVSLYAYAIVILIGVFTVSGLLYVRYFGEEGKWVEQSGYKPWGGPTAAIVYTAMTAFFLVALFVPPTEGSPFLIEIKWYVIPTVGLSFLLLGYAYYLGLMYVVPRFFKKGKMLVADREAVIVRAHGEYVQYLEIVDASWEACSGPNSNEDAEMSHRFLQR